MDERAMKVMVCVVIFPFSSRYHQYRWFTYAILPPHLLSFLYSSSSFVFPFNSFRLFLLLGERWHNRMWNGNINKYYDRPQKKIIRACYKCNNIIIRNAKEKNRNRERANRIKQKWTVIRCEPWTDDSLRFDFIVIFYLFLFHSRLSNISLTI